MIIVKTQKHWWFHWLFRTRTYKRVKAWEDRFNELERRAMDLYVCSVLQKKKMRTFCTREET